MDRRAFLRTAALGAAGAALAGCDLRLLDAFNEGEERYWGINVHPYEDPIRSAQLQALRQLAVRRARITLGLHQDLAGPYLRALSLEWIGILGDFYDPVPDAGAWPALVRRAVQRSPGVRFFELLNEPVSLRPSVYVERYLKPGYDAVKSLDPSFQVIAAAPTGTSGGQTWFFQMTEAGADDWCDHRGVHIYSDNPEVYLTATRRPFMITESGVRDPARHVDWWSKTMARMSGVLGTDRLYWYSLCEVPDNGWGLISNHSRQGRLSVVSPLYDYIRSKYAG